MTPTQDELAVRTLVDGLVAGWNAQDGTAFARQFAADADFTNVMGLHAKGRDVIARGHDDLRHVVQGDHPDRDGRADPVPPPDVAVASVVLALRQMDGTPWGAFPRSLASLIAVRDGESWSIALFRTWFPSSGRPPARSNVRSPQRPGAPPSVCDRLGRAGG